MFPHEDREFSQLLRIVAGRRNLAVGLVEKDYWVTHCLWALRQDPDLELWFKGGTSLSKGFSLIQRFSEDLDLRIDSVVAGVNGTAWPKKPTKAQETTRVIYFETLGARLKIPTATVSTIEIDAAGRGADYKVTYPGRFLETIAPPNSSFVKLEVGRALVTPSENRTITSFVHEYLEEVGQLKNYTDNRAADVRCVHPRVTLIEKLDAIAARFEKNREPSEFIRHYEDAARIIQAESNLPPLEEPLEQTAKSMASSLRLKRVAPANHPAFAAEVAKEQKLEDAYAAIAPMFWGPRLPLKGACSLIRA
ncbi:MAG: nucleotidyl transferase AbiEii/AbiGii toxin family protein, partial [Myxococcaceae bacterium]